MKKPASPGYGILAWVIYIGIILAWSPFSDADYDELADSTDNILQGIIIPVGIAALAMVIVATWLGWWKPALRERHASRHKWPIIAPLLVVSISVLNLANTDFNAVGTDLLLYLAIGTALVGFGEEMANRGLLLVGFRGRLAEGWVWFLTSVMFGLMHAGNILNGQEVGATMQQVGFTMLAGSIYYVTRRVTGSLIWAMLIHALWDFANLAIDASGKEVPALANVLNLLSIVAVLVALYFVIKGADERLDGNEAAPSGEPAPA